MGVEQHLRTTGSALGKWLVAQLLDSAAVGALWLIGLLILKVPLAPLWAMIAAVCQFVPQIGPILGLLGPALMTAADIVYVGKDWHRLLYLLILYAVIAVTDGFLLQPYLMRRTARVPMWASILAPVVLGFLIPFWGFLLAPPLLAVIYAYKARRLARVEGTLERGE